MRAAIDAWAKHVAVIVGDARDDTNVTPFDRSAARA
jgi:hypothetical protein